MSDIPREIGPYRIVSLLGSGGMGQVFRAFDPRLHREVAVKILPPEFQSDAVRRARFEHETRAIAALNHPNILSVYDVGDGWMVTELVEGESLRESRLTPRQIVDAGAQIADGLAIAHEAGITHRDLKPDNILLTRDGRPKILDFGLAKVHERAGEPVAAQTVTVPGTVLGTPGYMAPEQVRGLTADHRADLFALGVILYEQLGGNRAFDGPSFADILSATLNHDPPELPESVPAGLRQIVRRCMEKKPEQRFQSARDLAFALRNLAMHSTGSGVHALPPASQVTSRRRWVWPTVAAVATLTAVAGWSLWILNTGYRKPDLHFTPFGSGARIERNAAWSPDGKSVVYVETNDGTTNLVVKSFGDSAPVTIASNVPASGTPRWSGDGSRIYYVARGALMAISPTGGASETMIAGDVIAADVSPNGNTVAFWRPTKSKDGLRSSLWVASPPGTTPVEYQPSPFTVKGRYFPVFVRFSPDSRNIYLSIWSDRDTVAESWLIPIPQGKGQPRRLFEKTQLTRPAEGAWFPDSRRLVLSAKISGRVNQPLFLAQTNSNVLTTLLSWPEAALAPSVSPDGEKLLFEREVRDDNLVELPLDGSPIRSLLSSRQDENSVDWHPDGERFVYVTTRNGSPELLVRSVKSKWDRQIFGGGGMTEINRPVLSPDGSRVVFWGEESGRMQSYVLPLSGGHPTRLADGGYAPAWAPDSNSVAFRWTKPSGDRVLATVRLGLNVKPAVIADSSECSSPPEWAPSGEWIACAAGKQVRLYSPSGQPSRVLPGVGSDVIAWSKDSRTIYGVPADNGRRVLVAMDATTGAMRKIADYGASADVVLSAYYLFGLRLSLAPDGKSLATTRLMFSADLWIVDNFAEQLR